MRGQPLGQRRRAVHEDGEERALALRPPGSRGGEDVDEYAALVAIQLPGALDQQDMAASQQLR